MVKVKVECSVRLIDLVRGLLFDPVSVSSTAKVPSDIVKKVEKLSNSKATVVYAANQKLQKDDDRYVA